MATTLGSPSPRERRQSFTPGPWRVQHSHNGYDIECANRSHSMTIAAVNGRRSYEIEANARLIAAAPDLHEALDHMTDLFRSYLGDQSTEDGWRNDEVRDVWLQARAALAKASS